MSEPCHRGCTCGCCEGVEVLTPQPTANRPGLDALVYRAGVHATFLETMRARLSSRDYPELSGLATREASDFSLALLDAWATVADVLTFYQERIANEGYLRTATERRSVLELARLIGYRPRPGVAASTYLAFTLEKPVPPPPGAPGAPRVATPDESPEVVIPAGARAQSVSGPGELPQPFETSEDLTARAAWNDLLVRRTRPQIPDPKTKLSKPTLYFQGITTKLEPNDPLLIKTVADPAVKPKLYRVLTVEANAAAGRTKVTIAPWLPPPPITLGADGAVLGEEAVAEPAAPATEDLAAALRRAVERLRDVEAFGASPGSRAAGRVLAHLDVLSSHLDAGAAEPALRSVVEEQVLPKLREEHRLGLDGRFTKLLPWLAETVSALDEALKVAPTAAAPLTVDLAELLEPLARRRSIPPRSGARLGRDVAQAFGPGSDVTAQILLAARPELRDVLYKAWANAPVTEPAVLEVWALRLKARVFGHNAPLPLVRGVPPPPPPPPPDDWKLNTSVEQEKIVFLDSSYPQVLPGSWIVLQRPNSNLNGTPLVITTVKTATERSRAQYGITGKTTHVELADPWLVLGPPPPPVPAPPPPPAPLPAAPEPLRAAAVAGPYPDQFDVIRGTAVYAHPEKLELAEEPIVEPLCGGRLELTALHDGLKPGRWVIVSGERTDVAVNREIPVPGGPPRTVEVAVPGVPAAELVMVAEVEQGIQKVVVDGRPTTDYPGDRTHTTLVLAAPLSYCYRREDVKIWGNVAPATHGETKAEVLGSGDASKPLQRFTLKQSPLTFVSAATPSGIESTLQVRVNDLLWHESESLFGAGPTDRIYTTRQSDAGETTVVFGNGERGARPPTGKQNVRARYRVGIGKPGNLGAGRISQLVTRPLGVKDVVNPLPATGGADPESRDQARRNAPLAVMALDRLVSVQDYADFARTFAGIGKASAVRLSDGRAQLVHLTIAGEDDIPIDESSDLFQNLAAALRRFGDPHLPVQIAVRDLLLLVVAAGVRPLPDYEWDKVAAKVRAALFAAFAFARRDLARDALLSEAVRAIQSVAGVDFVDVDVFDAVRGTLDPAELARRKNLELKTRIPARPARLKGTGKQRTILPAELVYLVPAVPDTVILKELKA